MKEMKRNFVKFFILTVSMSMLTNGQDCETRRAIKIMAKSEKEMMFLHHLEDVQNDLNVIIERSPRRLNSSYIFTAADCKHSNILQLMKEHDITDYEVFGTTSEPQTLRRGNFVEKIDDPEIVTRKYLSYEEGNEYMNFMAMRINQINPKVSATINHEGQTYENRQIDSIRIEYTEKPDNPVIFIDAGIHAREWHARSMGLFLLAKLAEEAALGENGILFKATFVIVPSVNPDGYEFSRQGEKLWRKTRKPVANNCFGVDGNRNYDADWSSGTRELQPCNEVYRGPKPFSEEETTAIKNIMMRLRGTCKMYISIHTYGNSILYPWGYTHTRHPRDEQLSRIATAGVDAVLRETGSVFDAHSSSNLYVAAGGSDDYAIDQGEIPFAFTLELGAEELNFAVPESHLKQTLNEGWIVIKAMTLEAIVIQNY